MIFSSNVFLFVFLPIFLAVYYVLPGRLHSLWIVVGSWGFYAWWRIDFLLLYAVVTMWSYVFGHIIDTAPSREAAKSRMQIGIVGSLGVLAYFKYFNFLVENLNAALAAHTSYFSTFEHVILPIGVSFFVFESISYMVDIYRKDAPPARNFVDFAAFLALYPHLIAGPVMRYKDLSAQITSRTHTLAKFSEGCHVFMVGFCKKVLIADSVAPLADRAMGLSEPSFIDGWIGAIAYTVQLYFDFSGYSEMAIGLGLMIGFRLIGNFNSPYISRSITEFWRRWHISLSTWLRDYLYISLGGNRKGKVRTYVNLWLTMVLGGLWHGANWTFLIWGIWHGSLLALERLLGGKGGGSPYPRAIALPLTLFFVILGWVVFRAANLGEALRIYAGMFGLNGFGLTPELAWQIRFLDVAVLMVGIVVVFIEPRWNAAARARPITVMPWVNGLRLATVAGFGISILKLAADSYSPFLYFQF